MVMAGEPFGVALLLGRSLSNGARHLSPLFADRFPAPCCLLERLANGHRLRPGWFIKFLVDGAEGTGVASDRPAGITATDPAQHCRLMAQRPRQVMQRQPGTFAEVSPRRISYAVG